MTRHDPAHLDTARAAAPYVGQPIRRRDDGPLLTGRATFIDDIRPPGALHIAMVRSDAAHALIRGIDTSEALALAGVHAVLTGEELRRVADPQPIVWTHISNQHPSTSYAMAIDKVRYSGQTVAAVAAETRALAEDAAELVQVNYEDLPVVGSLDRALEPDAPRLFAEWPDNMFGSTSFTHGDVERAFSSADVIVTQQVALGRQFGCSLEGRGCVAEWDPITGKIEVWISAQSPNRVREMLSQVLAVPVHDIRVRVPALGGGFGSKADFYGDEVICCLLSRMTERPVRYIEDRRESFMATAHAREQRIEIELAATKEGEILALRANVVAALGGEIGSTGMGPAWLAAVMMPGPYRVPAAHIDVTGVVTNKTPYGAYRGWGQPKANFAMERAVDLLAATIGTDANSVRRANFVAPDAFPHFNGVAATYDSGRYGECLERCMQRVVDDGWLVFQQQARAESRMVGVGYASYVESTAAGNSRAMAALGLDQAGFDEAVVRMDSSGRVTVLTGQTDMGQGLTTVLAQVCADTLGIRIEEVSVVFGDTDACPYTGYGTGGSRAGTLAGTAVAMAASDLREQVLTIAAHQLEADAADLEVSGGVVTVRGVPSVSVSFADIGYAAYRRLDRVPPGTPPALQARSVFDPVSQAYSYGSVAVLVEVDPGTGEVDVQEYLMVHDCGTILNPQIVEGQLHGACAQAIGATLLEELVYDEQGQLLTTTFMDYLVPTAQEVPRFTLEHMETPAPSIPGGMKGVGEAGVIPGPSAIVAAIEDALTIPPGTIRRIPLRPEDVKLLIPRHRDESS
ncbi:MAG: xanthine dehydrogenase family protein molybdopterin-binding subunit [Acidimicrobiia bacterium]